MTPSRKLFALTPLCALLAAGTAHATNGMLMEGYGPISTGMGGASQAVDHGNAAMAQNPATLGLMAEGSRIDVAFGILGPDVKSSVMGMDAKSGGNSYVMPAFGYVKRDGAYTFGIGMFAQGGMGTEYEAATFMSAPAGVSSGLPSRSELGVGNVIFPLVYRVSPNLNVGATFKYLWTSLDLKMTASGAQLAGLAQASGVAPTGALASMLPGLAGAPWANISFSDDSKFTGAAKTTGYGASFGATLKVDKDVILGGSYQLKSKLQDMKTASGDASLTAIGGFSNRGQITVIDFQMPSVLAIGASWQVNPSLLLAADVKSIGWAESMKSFNMRYESATPGMGTVNFTMDQNWKDQTVLNFGMAWKANDQLTLRAGLNLADNPVPDTFVSTLFPATVRNHFTLGMGYRISDAGDFNISLTSAPPVTVNSGSGPSISHSQTNWQFMYSHRF